MYESKRFNWRGCLLYYENRSTGLSVVPEHTLPGMWRIQMPDGTLSDYLNLARAKDAAVDRGLATLNCRPPRAARQARRVA